MILLNLSISISFRAWADIIADFFLRPIFLPLTLNGNNYRQCLETQFHYRYAIKCSSCMMELQHFSTLKSSWIIITSIDKLVEEDPLLGLHVLPIWILRIFIYRDILRSSCMILLLLLWKYSEIVLLLRMKKYKILLEFFQQSMRRRERKSFPAISIIKM